MEQKTTAPASCHPRPDRSRPDRRVTPTGFLGIGLLLTLGAVAPGLPSLPAAAASVTVASTGISIEVDADRYRVDAPGLGTSFRGTLDGPALNVRVEKGADLVGQFSEIRFELADEAQRQASIRTWDGRPGVLFTQVVSRTCPTPTPFPSFSDWPELRRQLSWSGKWAVPRFDLSGPDGPWLLFDDRGRTAVLSPASDFMVSALRRGPAGELLSGFDARIETLPAGQAHRTLLVLENGINRAFETWGRILTDLQGKVRPPSDADASLATLGYWTDNGAAYYYQFDRSCGYEGTLLAVRDDFRRQELPIGYVQLDSWWYPKGNTGDWNPKPDQWVFGIGTYEAHPDVFPDGLRAFQERLGLPLVTHARWIDEKSPYRAKYRISNNVAVDPAYWDDVAAYLKESGVATYEQDWLDEKATAAFTLEDQDAFLDNMARSLSGAGITMQYCMPTPRHVLQGSKYSNLTSIRVSEDRFDSTKWVQAIYSSRLVSAVGIWPWVDVFQSCETADVLLATLSAGVVGAADAVGAADGANLRKAARADGRIVKPDVPLVPVDATYLAEAARGASPVVASTRSDHGTSRAVYLFACRRGPALEAWFDPRSEGLDGAIVVWDYRTGKALVANAADPLWLDLTGEWSYKVIVPVAGNGLALIGDLGKFATRGRTRFSSVSEDPSGLAAVLSFAPGDEAVTLLGYATRRPEARAETGEIVSLEWDRRTGLFRATVAPGEGDAAAIRIVPGPRASVSAVPALPVRRVR